MSLHLPLKTACLVTCLALLPAAYAASLSKLEYKDGKARIAADYKSDQLGCAHLAGNTKDVCIEKARGKEKVAYAELEYRYTGNPTDANKVLVAKAEANYAVAKELCDDQAGNAKDVCVKEAKAVELTALANAKMGKEISASKKDAAIEKRDADYAVAVEKCDALAGDAKASCVAAAKTEYGQH